MSAPSIIVRHSRFSIRTQPFDGLAPQIQKKKRTQIFGCAQFSTIPGMESLTNLYTYIYVLCIYI